MKRLMQYSLMIVVLMAAVALPQQSRATVTSDVQALVAEAHALQSRLVGTQVTPGAICAPLVSAGQAARSMVKSIESVNSGLVAPLTIDDGLMTALEDLSLANVQIGDEALRLAMDVQVLAPSVDALSIKDGLTAMLQLSDDIGAMADRIGEMADNILVMADNIGIMADRILLTQQIQSQNLALTQQSILQTQTNMLTLVSVVETATYDLDLNTLIIQGELLAADLAATVFSPFTIKYQLAGAAADVNNFLAQVKAMEESLKAVSAGSTVTVDSSTLTSLVNLSSMATSVSTVLDGYILVIQSMQAMIFDRNLDASLSSMLAMSADIGMLANSILEMADLILVMADNIGLAAEQIILTQQLQSGYLAISQASILATQEMAIGIIVAQNL
ncbi:MAG: hypothetical protein ABFS09_06885 [Thermodesulfobacteriota bacterium]